MTRQDEDREGAKPYRTYKARRPRRTQVDDELAGARPARPRPQPSDERAPTRPGRARVPPPVRQGLPHVWPRAGQRAQGRRQEGQEERRHGSAPPAPLPLVAHPRRASSPCSSSPAWWSPCWPGPGTRSSTGPSTRPTSASTRRPAPSSPPTTGGSGATAPRSLLFGLDAGRAPGALGHHHAHALRPQDAHDQPALDPPRHAGQRRRLRPDQDHRGHVVRRPVARPQGASRTTPASPSTTSWSWASRASRGWSTPSGGSTSTYRRRSPPARVPECRVPPSASSPSTRACTTSTARTRCSTCASATPTRQGRLHPRGAPAGLRAGAPEEAHAARPTSPSCPRSASTS